MVDKGNTVITIEHNLDIIRSADHVIDLGPEGGAKGGLVVATGTPDDILKSKESLTGDYLREAAAGKKKPAAKKKAPVKKKAKAKA